MRELALFAGAGGGILGGHLLGWRTVCAVERDAYAAQVLAQRQNDGCLPAFPIWSDVCSFDGKPWRGLVDVVSGGFPCQDISSAGKGAGIDGDRSSLWKHMARIVGDVRPKFVFVENSPLLVKRGLAVVISDLAKLGYLSAWGIISAGEHGANHQRKRIWIAAADAERSESRIKPCDGATRRVGGQWKSTAWNRNWEVALREFRGMDDGLAYGVERTDTIRNGQVPVVAATAFAMLTQSLDEVLWP